MTRFECQPISELTRPDGPPGLVMVNPPYGARIGNRKLLFGLYARLGEVLQREMRGWRVGLVTKRWRAGENHRLAVLATRAARGAWWDEGDALAHRSVIGRTAMRGIVLVLGLILIGPVEAQDAADRVAPKGPGQAACRSPRCLQPRPRRRLRGARSRPITG